MKKRILIVTKFYYSRGGDCVSAINLENLLKSQGHEVAIFAMQYEKNIDHEYTPYFATNVSFSGSLSNKLNAIKRLFGLGDIKSSFNKLLCDFKPDIVHLHNIHSYLSPVVAKLAHDKGLKVVWTMHDYKLLCPAYSCLNNSEACEICFDNKWNVLAKKCMKGSLVASAMAWGEALKWNKQKLMKWTDNFICPSQFMATKMEQGGFDKDQLTVLCNFLEDEKSKFIQSIQVEESEESYCYIGRLSQEKGVENLLKVASQMPYKLYIAGDGPMKEQLVAQYASENIIFLGHLGKSEIVKLLKLVSFSVIPSICYENNPLSVIESLCCGTPVLGANTGGIPELLNDEISETYQYNDLNQLKNKIKDLFIKSKNIDRKNLSLFSLNRFSSSIYYENLL